MDAIDHKIIGELRHNARANYGDIGDIVGLSASAVKRRVDKMVAEGTIRGAGDGRLYATGSTTCIIMAAR